jgi:hypothetical protein
MNKDTATPKNDETTQGKAKSTTLAPAFIPDNSPTTKEKIERMHRHVQKHGCAEIQQSLVDD